MAENLLIVAGEVSGDMHAAEVLHELKKLRQDITFFGIGGDEMQKQGMQLLYHINRMSFLGFAEVVKHLPFIMKIKRELMQLVKDKSIKTAILVDYPGFNLNIAKALKRAGVKIVYYISPQIWAWRSSRIHKIRAMVRKMLVVFPFEETLYRKGGVDAQFVGHPLMEQLSRYQFCSKDEVYAKYELTAGKDILLVLPGSRKQEVEKIFPDIIDSAIATAEQHNLQVIVACAPHIDAGFFDEYKSKYDFRVVHEHVFEFMKYAKIGLIKSGTSTLQAGLLGLPMVIVYKTSPLTYAIGKKLVKIEHIGLANIVAEKSVVPEILQDELTTENITATLNRILSNTEVYQQIKKEFAELGHKLGDKRASVNAALIINEVLLEG